MRDDFPWGKVATLYGWPDAGRNAVSSMNVGAAACPDAPASKDCAESIDAVTDGTEKSLPLEGKVARATARDG